MLHSLERHVDTPCESVTQLAAWVTRDGVRLSVRYVINGNIAALQIPSEGLANRVDDLWQHTCFEAFLCADQHAYFEFNWSPSKQWAGYRFSDYRKGMTNAAVGAPIIMLTRNADQLELQATIDCQPLALHNLSWRLGVAAVIEETNGGKSYWALKHPPGKPDFHHPAGFSLELGT